MITFIYRSLRSLNPLFLTTNSDKACFILTDNALTMKEVGQSIVNWEGCGINSHGYCKMLFSNFFSGHDYIIIGRGTSSATITPASGENAI
jgi:hypothetical protein